MDLLRDILDFAPLIGVFLAALVTATWISRLDFFTKIPEVSVSNRVGTLDGLRGFLALSVFVHHLAIHRSYLRNSLWIAPFEPVFRNAGPLAVDFFFMITGFLFWTQALKKGGRFPWKELAISRISRIAPLYLVAMLLTLGIAGSSVAWKFDFDSIDLAGLVIRLVTFGALNIQFLSDISLMPINAGVTWTLVYEWGFYFALVFASWFATRSRFVFLGGIMVTIMALHPSYEIQQVLYFFLGICAAQLKFQLPTLAFAESKQASWLLLILLLLGFLQRNLEPVGSALLLLFPAFLLMVYGTTLFGILKTPGALVLGASSYSIYLLHGVFLFVCLHTVFRPEIVLSAPSSTYWAIAILSVPLLVGLCALTYRWIEYPAIRYGKKQRQNLSNSATV